MERIDHIFRKVRWAWRHYLPERVAVEEYAFSRSGAHSHRLGELGGVVKHWLWRQEALVLSPTSSELKKWVTGNGAADKQRMMDACDGFTTGWDCQGNDNLADAFHCARYAAYHVPESA